MMLTSLLVAVALSVSMATTAATAAAPHDSFEGVVRSIDQAEARPAPLDVNKATAEELQTVPGIGATLAQRIVAFRTEHGPFEKVDDLLNVQGIGVTSLEKLRPYLIVKPQK